MSELRNDSSTLPPECLEAMQVYLGTQEIVTAETTLRGVPCEVYREVYRDSAADEPSLVLVAARPKEGTSWNFGNCFPELPGAAEEGDSQRRFRMRFLTLGNPLWLFIWSHDGQLRPGQVRDRLLAAPWFKEWARLRGVTDFDTLGFAESDLQANLPAIPDADAAEGSPATAPKTSCCGMFLWGSIGQTSAAREAGQAVIEQLPWLADIEGFLGTFDVLFAKAKVEYKGAFPFVTLQWPPGGFDFGGDGLSFKNATINISSIPYLSPQDTSVGIEGDFVFSEDQRIHVDLIYPIDGDLIWASGRYTGGAKDFLGDQAALGLPDPKPADRPAEQIELELEFSKAARTLTKLSFAMDLHEDWSLLKEPISIKLKGLGAWVTIYQPLDSSARSVLAQFTAEATFGYEGDGGKPVELACGGSYPSGDLFLQARNSLPVGKLIEKVVGPSEALENLTIEDLRIGYNYVSGDLSLALDVQEKWPIVTGFEVEEVRFQVERRKAEKGSTGSLAALLKFAPGTAGEVAVSLSGAYGEGGWQLEGSTGPGQDIPIGELLDYLAGKFSAAKPELPEPLKDLVLKDLSVAFNTKSKDFRFSGEGDLPVSAQSSVAIRLAVAVEHAQPPAGSTLKLSGQCDVRLGDTTLQFTLQLDHAATTDKLLATYHHDGNLPLDISALLAALASGDDELGALIAGLNIEVDVRDIKLGFRKEASKSLFGLSLGGTVSFGGKTQVDIASFLMASFERGATQKTSKFLFGVKIAAELNLASQPLVSSMLPPGQTFGVKDLQLFAASQSVQQNDLDQAKALLDADKVLEPKQEPRDLSEGAQAPVPENVLECGVTLDATLMVGAEPPRALVLAPSRASPATRSPKVPPAAAPSGEVLPAPETLPATEPVAPPAAPTAPSVKWIQIQKSFGPVRFDRLGFQFQSKDQVIWFLLDASLAAAGLTISLDGLGFGSSIKKFEPKFDLAGLGINFKRGQVEIGGAFLKVSPWEYRGQVLLKTGKFSLSAIGLYECQPKLPPSMFIYAFLDYPLGGPPVFYVTGLAAGFGYNRALVMPTIDQVMNFPLVTAVLPKPPVPGKAVKPPDPGEALTKLIGPPNYLPAQMGQYFLAAGVRFTSFKMIESFVMLAVSFGERLEINLLGLSTIKIPAQVDPQKPSPCLAVIQVALKASYIPDEGFLEVLAQLTSASYILSKDCRPTGGLAFRSWFAGEHSGDFALTVGGYHPAYRVPAYYPQVPRLAIGWKINNNLSIKGSAYFALTPSALMAGASLEANFSCGAITAWFRAQVDFIIAWKPFYYDAYIRASVGVAFTIRIRTWFGTWKIRLSASLGADLHIWGPEFSGTAHIRVSFISFTIAFGAGASQSREALPWPDFRGSFLPKDILSASVNNGLISGPKQAQSGTEVIDLGVINPADFALAVDTAIPVKSLNGSPATCTVEGKEVMAASVGIAPMKIADLALDLKIEIRRLDGPDPGPCTDKFQITAVPKNVPAGLWGQAAQPDLNSDPLVKNVISGFEITARHPATIITPPPAQAEPQLLKASMASYALGLTESAPAVEGPQDMARSQPQANERELTLPCEQDLGLAKEQALSDEDRRQAIKANLAKAGARRLAMLAALGFESGAITIDDGIAEAFVIAPQIETLKG